MAKPPSAGLCSECNQAAPVTEANPVYSAGHHEPTRWLIYVNCPSCGVQSGWLPR
ncbi:hypothetical protein [Mycolicibacterium mucogenicum]|uniref:DUF7160 family protein n=1 Tax=Mycolicibacterium mucogenicum TaxID=56689 RepID=UPI003AF3A127